MGESHYRMESHHVVKCRHPRGFLFHLEEQFIIVEFHHTLDRGIPKKKRFYLGKMTKIWVGGVRWSTTWGGGRGEVVIAHCGGW